MWHTPRVWLPHDKITAAALNQQIRDNLLEQEIPKTDVIGDVGRPAAFVVAAGPNAIATNAFRQTQTNSTLTTSSSSPVATGLVISGLQHTGSFQVFISAHMSTTSGIANVSMGVDGMTATQYEPSIIRAARTSSNTLITATTHVMHYKVTAVPATVRVYMWTSGGTMTLERHIIRILPF